MPIEPSKVQCSNQVATNAQEYPAPDRSGLNFGLSCEKAGKSSKKPFELRAEGFCGKEIGTTGFEPSCGRPSALAIQFPHQSLRTGSPFARQSDTPLSIRPTHALPN